MSAMSEIATELDYNWQPTRDGYTHLNSDYRIMWWNSNHDTVSLYRRSHGEWPVVLHGVDLAVAVHHVMDFAG